MVEADSPEALQAAIAKRPFHERSYVTVKAMPAKWLCVGYYEGLTQIPVTMDRNMITLSHAKMIYNYAMGCIAAYERQSFRTRMVVKRNRNTKGLTSSQEYIIPLKGDYNSEAHAVPV